MYGAGDGSHEPNKPAAKKFAFAYTQKAKPAAKKPKNEALSSENVTSVVHSVKMEVSPTKPSIEEAPPNQSSSNDKSHSGLAAKMETSSIDRVSSVTTQVKNEKVSPSKPIPVEEVSPPCQSSSTDEKQSAPTTKKPVFSYALKAKPTAKKPIMETSSIDKVSSVTTQVKNETVSPSKPTPVEEVPPPPPCQSSSTDEKQSAPTTKKRVFSYAPKAKPTAKKSKIETAPEKETSVPPSDEIIVDPSQTSIEEVPPAPSQPPPVDEIRSEPPSKKFNFAFTQKAKPSAKRPKNEVSSAENVTLVTPSDEIKVPPPSQSSSSDEKQTEPAAKKFSFVYSQKAKPTAKKSKIESSTGDNVISEVPQNESKDSPPEVVPIRSPDNQIAEYPVITSPASMSQPSEHTTPSKTKSPRMTPSKYPPSSPQSSGQTNKRFNFAYTSHQKPVNKKINDSSNLNEFQIVELDGCESTTSSHSLFQRACRPWVSRTNIPKSDKLPDPNDIDPSTTRLRDLFYVIPTKYPPPKYRLEREAKKEEEKKLKAEMRSGSQVDDAMSQHSMHSTVSEEVKSIKPDVHEDVAVPTETNDDDELDLEVDEDGNIVIRQECLLKAHKQREVVDDRRFVQGEITKANYNSFRKRPVVHNPPWRIEEMVRFYHVLSTVGTDFGTMARLIPGRTREQVHMKYKSEVKRNAHLIDQVFRHPKKYNLKIFSDKELQSELADNVRLAHGSGSRRRKSFDTTSSVNTSISSKAEELAKTEKLAEMVMKEVCIEEANRENERPSSNCSSRRGRPPIQRAISKLQSSTRKRRDST